MSAAEALRRLGGTPMVACDGCGETMRHPASCEDPGWVELDAKLYFVCSNRCRIRVRTQHRKRRRG